MLSLALLFLAEPNCAEFYKLKCKILKEVFVNAIIFTNPRKGESKYMNTIVLIDGITLTDADLEFLNYDNENGVFFGTTNQKNFLPAETVLIIIEIAQNLGYSAIYDILKFSLLKVVDFVGNKTENKETKIEIDCNGKKVSLNCNFVLTKKQKDKFIDAAIKKLLDD